MRFQAKMVGSSLYLQESCAPQPSPVTVFRVFVERLDTWQPHTQSLGAKTKTLKFLHREPHTRPLMVLTLLMRVLAKFLYSCMQLPLLKKSLCPLPPHHLTYWSAPPTCCQLSVMARMACKDSHVSQTRHLAALVFKARTLRTTLTLPFAGHDVRNLHLLWGHLQQIQV